MATIKEATDRFVKEFLIPNKMIYGVGDFPCSCCDKPYIEVVVDKNIDKNILNKIPSKYMGFRVEKKFGEQAVAQKQKDHIIAITPKGTLYWQKNVLTGGYNPEDVSLLLDIKNQPTSLQFLSKSPIYKNLNGLVMYLHAKGLVSIDGMISPNAENFSNARGGGGRRGGGGGRGGVRMATPRRVAPVRRSAPRRRPVNPVRRHINHVRRNYNWGYPYAVGVYPPVAYYYDIEHPKRIKITKKGLSYLKKSKKGAYQFLLENIKNGLVYNETLLKNSLKISDFERVVGWLRYNGMIRFV